MRDGKVLNDRCQESLRGLEIEMTKLGFIGKIGEKFFPRRGASAGGLAAHTLTASGETCVAAKAGERFPLAVPATDAPALEGLVAKLLEAMQKQQQQVDTLLRQLAAPKASPLAAPADLTQTLKRVGEKDHEIASALQDITSESQKQTDALRGIQTLLAEGDKKESHLEAILHRLTGVMENSARANATHVELIEQVRDRLTGTNDELTDMIARHQKRLTWLLGAFVGLLTVLAGALAVRGFFR